jgi:hypothetical protein
MDGVSWPRTDPYPWLVTARPEGQQAVGGVTFGAGFLNQPTEQLGVAGLFAAWLTSSLSRPVEASDPAAWDEPVRVLCSPGQTDTSLVVAGASDGVLAALRRAGDLLANPAAAEVDQGLRDRSHAYQNPLQPWRHHLAARWAGHRPHLTAMGPLAVGSLDAAALAWFVASELMRAPRAYWTSEPSLAEQVNPPAGPPPRPPEPPVLRLGRDRPGCVIRRSHGELFSVAMPAGIPTEIGLSLLLRVLHRRLVEFEALATQVRIGRYEVGSGLVIAGVDADPLPGKEGATRAAAVQTLQDVAGGAVSAEEIGQVRDWYATDDEPYSPGAMAALARRHLLRGDFPTAAAVADEVRGTDDAAVRAALATGYRELLVAVPFEEAEQPPFPMAERVKPHRAEGRRFRDRLNQARAVRCSPRRVGIVDRGTTAASVDFAEVALRMDTGDQATTLVDRQLRSVQLVWDAHRRGQRLRELVDQRTPPVPLIREPPDPEWTERFAGALRKQRRQMWTGIGIIVGIFLALIVVIAVGESLDSDPDPRAEDTVETVDAGTTVTLDDGTTVGVAAGPELIEHYGPDLPYTYAVQVRMCGGEGRDAGGTMFAAGNYRLDAGEQGLRGFFGGVQERPGLREGLLADGECATGWLLYHLPEPTVPAPATLTYENVAGDSVTWRLPPPATSELSRPCPTVQPAFEPLWQGCPTPTPG